jgi:hypothetical protein
MESLERISIDKKYHDKTRELAALILQKYKAISKDSKIEKLLDLMLYANI